MSQTTRVLAGLVAGFLLGLALSGAPPFLPDRFSAVLVAVISPIGTIFVNLIRMTVIPLVVSMLVASVGSMATSGVLGRLGVTAMAIAVGMLVVAAMVSILIAQPVLASVHIDQAAAMTLRGSVPAATPVQGSETGSAPDGSGGLARALRWLIDLVPPNVVKAAGDGAMLPLIVFAVLFGLSLAHVKEDRRTAVLQVTRGLADAMQRLVAGILKLAPLGVFALAVPLAFRLGLGAAAAVVSYVALVVALTVATGALLLYPVGIIGGRMSLSEFIAFCAPAQAVAFASRSSLAALPAMVESAERAGLPAAVTGFLLPLAASVFRIGGAVAQTVGVLFLARLYGVTLSPAELVSVAFTVVLTTFAVPGIPGGSMIAMVPVLAVVNLPIDGIGILLAVDTVPDMFRTTENATGILALAAALRKRSY